MQSMTKLPTISVIIPNYNYARYLPKRIESILDQTYKDFEIIILDDGSRDDSVQVILFYLNLYPNIIKPVIYKENSQSTYKRWNDGAALAAGKYIIFAGADDYCDPTMLGELVSCLENNPGCAVSYCDSYIVDEDGLIKRRASERKRIHQEPITNVLNNQAVVRAYFENAIPIPNASSALIRRHLFEEVGGFNLDYKLAADVLLWIKLSSRADIFFIDRPLNFYRKHGDSATDMYRERYKLIEAYMICASVYYMEGNEKILNKTRNRYGKQLAERIVHDPLFISESGRPIFCHAKKFDKFIFIRVFYFIVSNALLRARHYFKISLFSKSH